MLKQNFVQAVKDAGKAILESQLFEKPCEFWDNIEDSELANEKFASQIREHFSKIPGADYLPGFSEFITRCSGGPMCRSLNFEVNQDDYHAQIEFGGQPRLYSSDKPQLYNLVISSKASSFTLSVNDSVRFRGVFDLFSRKGIGGIALDWDRGIEQLNFSELESVSLDPTKLTFNDFNKSGELQFPREKFIESIAMQYASRRVDELIPENPAPAYSMDINDFFSRLGKLNLDYLRRGLEKNLIDIRPQIVELFASKLTPYLTALYDDSNLNYENHPTILIAYKKPLKMKEVEPFSLDQYAIYSPNAPEKMSFNVVSEINKYTSLAESTIYSPDRLNEIIDQVSQPLF